MPLERACGGAARHRVRRRGQRPARRSPTARLSEIEQQVLYYAKHKTGGFDPQAHDPAAARAADQSGGRRDDAVRRAGAGARRAATARERARRRPGGSQSAGAHRRAAPSTSPSSRRASMRAENALNAGTQCAQGAGGADRDHHHRRSAAHRAAQARRLRHRTLRSRSWRPAKALRRSPTLGHAGQGAARRPAARGWSRSRRCARIPAATRPGGAPRPAHRRACAPCSGRRSSCCRASSCDAAGAAELTAALAASKQTQGGDPLAAHTWFARYARVRDPMAPHERMPARRRGAGHRRAAESAASRSCRS